MKLLVFGATGSIGQHVIKQALQQGHKVTAFARRPLSDQGQDSLQWIKGDVLDETAVQQAMPGHDAVMVVLGAGRKGGIRANGTRNIIQAMQHSGITRLVCQSTLGAGDSYGNLNFAWKYIMFGLLLKHAFEDHQQQEQLVRTSGLDWTIVRPGAFTDGDRTGQYRHGFAPHDRSTALKISRADVAHFLLKQLHDHSYLHQSPGLSY